MLVPNKIMSDDTDEHEFHVERDADGGSDLSDQPASVSGDALTQHKLQLQKMEDDKLLTDADIPVEGMSDDEKRQILWALRESLPQPAMESPAPALSSPPPGPSEVEEEDENDDEGYLPEDPLHTLPVTAVDDDGDQVCNSTTSTGPPRPKKGRPTRRIVLEPDAVSASDAPKTGRTRKCRRQQRQCTDTEIDSDACSSTSKVSEGGDGFRADLLPHSLKKMTDRQREQMKLSSKQKQQSQTRFKDLYNKMSQGSAPCCPSPVREGGKETAELPQSSQDLFEECLSDEEESDTKASVPEAVHSKGSTSSSDVIISKEASQDSAAAAASCDQRDVINVHDQSDDSDSSGDVAGRQEFGVPSQHAQGDDLETQPPEDFVLCVEEEEAAPGEAKAEEQGNRSSSPVYLMQVSQSGCSSPRPHCSSSSRETERISQSKLPVHDEQDKRPLLHDNWFSWPELPVCHLQRIYRVSPRKRKEPPVETPPYICPESHTPAEYSKVILQMFDSYLLRFTQAQRCLKKLPWGKPIRAGQHVPGSMDWKKRGGHCFHFDLDEDDDFETGQPPPKKLSTEGDWQKQPLGVGLPQGGQASAHDGAEEAAGSGEGNQLVRPGDAGDSAAVQEAAYDAETLQFDSDNDLPDIQLGSSQLSNTKQGSQGVEEQHASPSPIPAGGGSQSSNSLLDESGDLYSTQLPRRKRTAEVQTQAVVSESEARSKRVCKAVQPSQRCVQKGDRGTQRLGMKRKPASPDESADSQVYVLHDDDDDDDDDEVTFPQAKRSCASVRERRFVHISTSSSNRAGSKLKLNVVPPRPRQGTPSGNGSEAQHTIWVNADARSSHFQPVGQGVSSSADAKLGPSSTDVEESDDSVQFVEVSTLAETEAEARAIQDSQARASPAPRDDMADHAAASHSQPTEQMVSAKAEVLVECPICSSKFPAAVIEQHASDCTGEDSVEDLQQPSRRERASTSNVLRRRPLHLDRKREEFVCGLCNSNFGGSSAQKRHFEKCKQQFETEAASTSTGASSRPAAVQWLSSVTVYKIPKSKDTSQGRGSAKHRPSEEEICDIEEDSDDSCKDPDFTFTKDDKRQEKEDMSKDVGTDEETSSLQPDVLEDDRRNEENGSSSFQPISKLKGKPADFHSQFARKPRQKRAKPKQNQSK